MKLYRKRSTTIHTHLSQNFNACIWVLNFFFTVFSHLSKRFSGLWTAENFTRESFKRWPLCIDIDYFPTVLVIECAVDDGWRCRPRTTVCQWGSRSVTANQTAAPDNITFSWFDYTGRRLFSCLIFCRLEYAQCFKYIMNTDLDRVHSYILYKKRNTRCGFPTNRVHRKPMIYLLFSNLFIIY